VPFPFSTREAVAMETDALCATSLRVAIFYYGTGKTEKCQGKRLHKYGENHNCFPKIKNSSPLFNLFVDKNNEVCVNEIVLGEKTFSNK